MIKDVKSRTRLDRKAQRLLRVLVNFLAQAIPGKPQTYISYKEIHNKLGLQLQGATYGISLQRQGLTELTEWTKQENRPAITGLIVTENERMPGEGFFPSFGKSRNSFRWWEEQIRLSKEHDWSPYLAG
jgi:hypothetical protein